MNFLNWEIAGFIFVVIFGTLLHFFYDWSGNNPIVGILSPVNESTWEHLKLLFIPMILYSIIEYFIIGNKYSNFIAAKSFGAILGMLAIIIAFYTYTGIIGEHYLWADILTFIVGVAVAYKYSWKIIFNDIAGKGHNLTGLILLGLVFFCFVIFTFFPPQLALFLDPVSEKYGIFKKEHSHQ